MSQSQSLPTQRLNDERRAVFDSGHRLFERPRRRAFLPVGFALDEPRVLAEPATEAERKRHSWSFFVRCCGFTEPLGFIAILEAESLLPALKQRLP
jgi:hypothetical protein